MASSSGFVLAATILILVASAAKVPPGWKTCKRSLPPAEYEPCITNAFKGALDDLFDKGAPTLHIPSLTPLKIPSLVIGQGSGPVSIDVRAWDIEIYNFNYWQLRKIRSAEIDKFKFGADVTFDRPILWNSKYEINGQVLVLPIKGHGDCRIKLENHRAQFDIYGAPYKKGGETYWNVTDLKYNFDNDRVQFYFGNLFNGNKELGDTMNRFLNENQVAILKELKPALNEGISLTFKNIITQIFDSVPFNKLFPE